jgi:tetratricopeptide (TPR) repeat protein
MHRRVERLWPLLALAGIALMAALAFPYLASAYYLEAGGRAMDDAGRAEQLLNRAIEWDSKNAQAYRLLGRAYREQGNFESALEMISTYTALRGENPLGHAELAGTYEAMKAAGASVPIEDLQKRIIDEWRQAGMTTANLMAAGEAARQAQDYDVGVGFYKRAMQLEPDAGDPWYYLGVLYENQEQWQMALEAYAQAEAMSYLRQVKRSNPAYRAGLIYHQRLGEPDLDQALLSLERALALNDFDSNLDAAHCHYLAGYVLRQQKAQPDSYIAAFQRAIALNPNHAWAHILLGMGFYERDRDVARAEAEILEALEIDPAHQWAFYYLGHIYSAEKLWNAAASMYQEALNIDPDFEAAASRLRAISEEQN